MPRNDHNLTAIELGTGAIKACMGVTNRDGTLTFAGYEEVPARDCIRKGEIVSANTALDLVGETLNRLETQTGKTVGPVYLAVTGDHFTGSNAVFTVPITSPDRVVTEQDLVVATRSAREQYRPPGKVLVHSYQRAYVLDDARRVSNPVGLVAGRLSAEIHQIFADHNRIETLLRLLLNVLGEQVMDIVFSGIASFHGLAPMDEVNQGVLLIDMGAGVTEYVLFYGEGCLHSGQLSVGCDHLANDLALGLRLPLEQARELVCQQGAALVRADAALRQVAIPDRHGHCRLVPEANVHRIMEARLLELFELIREDLDRQDLRALLGGGVVLAGGGALIPRLDQLAHQVFQAPARLAHVRRLPGLPDALDNPRCLTPVGLLCLGHHFRQIDQSNSQPLHQVVRQELGSLIDFCRHAIRL